MTSAWRSQPSARACWCFGEAALLPCLLLFAVTRMKILAMAFAISFLAGLALLWSGLIARSPSGDGGRADAAAGVALVSLAVLGWTLQLLVHALDVWLRRRRRRAGR